jgi:aryl-alcohol dehydrogenase-like predicted oxidoreductase
MSSTSVAPRRRLGTSDLWVSPVGFGCWPLAGITSIVDSDAECIATIQAALDAGINFFDTAYSYGYAGESDALLKRALQGRRGDAIIASKVGLQWDSQRKRVLDARPATLLANAAEILQRLGVDYVDVMYLHTPDEQTPIEESAAAIQTIVDRGWAKYAAVSNVTPEQAERFQRVCPVIAVQPYFNMLQQEAVIGLRDFCRRHQVALVCYWVLMKGLLAGHLSRNHQFDPRDRRLNYEIFQGESWQRNQDFLDRLRTIAARQGCTVSQLVIAWTLAQPDITVALCGAKHPPQIADNAHAMYVQLDSDMLAEIDACIAQRGPVS